jgi:CheY-like chemotaxis protein
MSKNFVLIVDDDPLARELAKAVVASIAGETFDIEFAADGGSAVDMLKDRLPVLILLDLMMPRMTGFDVLKRLTSQPTTRSICVIVVSAVDYCEMTLLESIYGVSAVVRKGEGVGPLHNAVKKALSSLQSGRIQNG